jgi:soluble lytic murein transglycosylase
MAQMLNKRGDMQLSALHIKRISLIILVLISLPAFALPESVNLEDSRLSHARELLGKSFKKKVIRKEDSKISGVEITDFVLETTRTFLSKSNRKKSQKIGYAILNAAEEFSLDPVFLMAVIQNESSFDPKKRGSVGEIGLMQILPRTAEWIAGLYGLEYKNEKSLLDPALNIWIGAALLDKLRHQFDSEGRLYVSAYNVGPKKLRLMLSMNKNPKIYVQAVMKRYIALYQGFKTKGDLKVLSQTARLKVMEITN